MKLFILLMFIVVSFSAYFLGRRDSRVSEEIKQSELMDAMHSIDFSRYSSTEEIKKAVAEKLGVSPDDIFIERFETTKNQDR